MSNTAIVTGAGLEYIAKADLKHDAGIGMTQTNLHNMVKPTIPADIAAAHASWLAENPGFVDNIRNEEGTMKHVFPAGTNGDSANPGDNLMTWRNLKQPAPGAPRGTGVLRWVGNDPVQDGAADRPIAWGKFDYTIKGLHSPSHLPSHLPPIGSLGTILEGKVLNLVVDTKMTSVARAADGIERITWVETVETLHDPAPKNVIKQAADSEGTFWGRDSNIFSFFPQWKHGEGAIDIKNIHPPSTMFFSNFDLSLYIYVRPNGKRISYMHYYSPDTKKSILIEGTGGVTSEKDAAGNRYSLTACNPNLHKCRVTKMFTRFKTNFIGHAVKSLNKIFKSIRKTIFTNPPKGITYQKEILRLAADDYHPEHFVVGKRLGDQGQALACLREINITEYGDGGKKPIAAAAARARAARPAVNVFVTADRLAFLAALYYRVPAAIYCWGTNPRDPKSTGGAFIAYRTELDTPLTQFNDLVTRIEGFDPLPPLPLENNIQHHSDALKKGIADVITKANADIKTWWSGAALNKSNDLSKIYRNLLGLMLYVGAIQALKNVQDEYQNAKMYYSKLAKVAQDGRASRLTRLIASLYFPMTTEQMSQRRRRPQWVLSAPITLPRLRVQMTGTTSWLHCKNIMMRETHILPLYKKSGLGSWFRKLLTLRIRTKKLLNKYH